MIIKLQEFIEIKKYERKVNSLERMLQTPYSVVTLVARIKGNISGEKLKNSILKAQKRHALLRVRIKREKDGEVWFTSEDIKDIPIEIIQRKSDNHWIEIQSDLYKIPFKFLERPAIKFVLVQSPSISELIICCHHIICDGMSLAFLARDILTYLGNSNLEVDVLPDPVSMDKNNMPKDLSLSGVVKFAVNKINQKWANDKIIFNQEDYENISQAYWANFTHRIISIELSKSETSELIDRCKTEGVSVNTALSTAIMGAQIIVQGKKSHNSKIAIASNLRDRLQVLPGEAMGYYASAITLKYKYNMKIGFWKNARDLQEKVKPLYINEHLFKESLLWAHLDPGILEALVYKMAGKLVQPNYSKYEKLSNYSKKNDVILSMLKKEKMDSFSNIILGAAATNLGNLDFPEQYGELKLDRLMMNPGGAFPLAMVNVVLGAVTTAGKLSLIIEYAEERLEEPIALKIKEELLKLLLNN